VVGQAIACVACLSYLFLVLNETALKSPVQQFFGQLERQGLEMDQVDGV
jgi:hypothetical protein